MSRKKCFDSWASEWDQNQPPEEMERIKNLVSSFGLKSNSLILDLGCGTGVLLPFLTDSLNKKSKVFALDFSFNMLLQAKKKFLNKNIYFINASAEKLPFKNDFFDYVTCFSAFPHFEDKLQCLKESNRVLKTKGKLFIAHLLSSQEIKKHHSKAGGEVSQDLLPEENEMKKLLIDSNYKNIEITDLPSLYLAKAEKK
jgi:ubiquinone/menaquinone biosynthesis C-methylase UbiE